MGQRPTDRQREALYTAWRAGYFERPRESGSGEAADAIGIAQSTLPHHLHAAKRKLLDAMFEFPDPRRDGQDRGGLL